MVFSVHTTQTCTDAKSIFSDAQKVLKTNKDIFILLMYSPTLVSADSVSAVYRGPKKNI
jgi:hypothetical protein